MGTPTFPSLDIYPPALNPWLNINQLEAITRVKGFVVVPPLAIGVPYVNNVPVARKVLQLDYTVQPDGNEFNGRNFSFRDLSALNAAAINGWTFTVAWATTASPENIVTRYIIAGRSDLTQTTLGALATFPVYQGEPIPSTFSIEVWDMGLGTYANGSILPVAVNLDTTILGNMDSRYGTDFPITGVPTFNPIITLNGPTYTFPLQLNIVVVGIPASTPLLKPLSNESLQILTNTPGSVLLPN